MTWFYTLLTKTSDEIGRVFEEFCASAEKPAAYRKERAAATSNDVEVREIQRFRSDNGKGEYDNKQFRNVLRAKGISFEPSAPYTPHQNGVSERKIQTI